MDEEQFAREEWAFQSSIAVLRYEIRKNERKIRECQRLAQADRTQASVLQFEIADAERRILQLKQRCVEMEEREEEFRTQDEEGRLF